MILDALGAKAGDDDDVLDPVRDERRDLPADQAATVELDQAFGDVAGQRQQARTLPGRQDDGFVDGHRGWPIAASRRAANIASISPTRSEESSVGKECDSTCSSRASPST